jgi:hypothetical protein
MRNLIAEERDASPFTSHQARSDRLVPDGRGHGGLPSGGLHRRRFAGRGGRDARRHRGRADPAARRRGRQRRPGRRHDGPALDRPQRRSEDAGRPALRGRRDRSLDASRRLHTAAPCEFERARGVIASSKPAAKWDPLPRPASAAPSRSTVRRPARSRRCWIAVPREREGQDAGRTPLSSRRPGSLRR